MNSDYQDKEFKNKYLKYKKKYLELKSLIGGVKVDDLIYDKDNKYLGTVESLLPSGEGFRIINKVNKPFIKKTLYNKDKDKTWFVKNQEVRLQGELDKVFARREAKKREIKDKEQALENIKAAFKAARDREAQSLSKLTPEQRLAKERAEAAALERQRAAQAEIDAAVAELALYDAEVGQGQGEGEALPYWAAEAVPAEAVPPAQASTTSGILAEVGYRLREIFTEFPKVYGTLALTESCSALIFFEDFDYYEAFYEMLNLKGEKLPRAEISSQRFKESLPRLKEQFATLPPLRSQRIYDIRVETDNVIGIIYLANYEQYLELFKSIVEIGLLPEGSTPLTK